MHHTRIRIRSPSSYRSDYFGGFVSVPIALWHLPHSDPTQLTFLTAVYLLRTLQNLGNEVSRQVQHGCRCGIREGCKVGMLNVF